MNDQKMTLILLQLATVHAKLDELLSALPNARQPEEPQHLSEAQQDRIELRTGLHVAVQNAALESLQAGQPPTETEAREAAEIFAAEANKDSAETLDRIQMQTKLEEVSQRAERHLPPGKK